MTDVQTTANETQEDNQAARPDLPIAQLKKKATLLGIEFKGNISASALAELVEAKLNAPVGGGNEEASQDTGKSEPKGTAKQTADAEADQRQTDYNAAMKLIRVIITPMEATKASNLESEIFCAGNSAVGTVKRTIPFGVEWHVEQILLNSIKEKKYQQFISKKNAAGIPITTARLVSAYSISVLDPLTPEELKELADLQLRTRSLEDE